MSRIETITVNGTTYDIGGGNGGGASVSPTPDANLTESGIVTAINSALPTSENAPSLYGVQVWSNLKIIRVIYPGTIPVGATGIGEWQDSFTATPTAEEEAEWGWWYNEAFKFPSGENGYPYDFKLKYDPELGEEPLSRGGYILDTTTGYLCIKFGKATTTATHKVAVDILIIRNDVG